MIKANNMNKNIEVEGKEIAIQNSHGDIAIIPIKDVDKVKEMLKNPSEVDDFVSKLPKMSEYAEDGSLIPGDPVNKTVKDSTSVPYKVKSGDTFFGIANRNNISKEELTRLNPSIDINILKVDQPINLGGVQPSNVAKSSPKKSGITNDLLMRQAYKESTFNPNAQSPAGYKGLTQIGDGVISDYNRKYKDRVIDPFNPRDAVDVQKYSMDDLYNASFINKPNQTDEVRIAKTLASYNWGRGNMEKYLTKNKKSGKDIYNSLNWVEGLPKETRDYVTKILMGSNEGFEKDYSKAIGDVKNKQYLDLYK